jgi:type I restriction enzyme S subunit
LDSAFYREEEFQDTQRGIFPEEWKILRFNEFLSLEYGKGLPEQKRTQGMYPVVGSNGIIGYHNRAFVKGPGIVIGRKGTIGAVTWIDSDFWPIDTTYYVNVTSGDVDLKWLFYELIHLGLPKLSLADVVPGLKRDLVNNLVVPLPPLAEQRGIVGVLGVVDLAVAKAGEVIAKTERLKKGLMQTLLTRGIGHKEYKQTQIGTIPKEWEVASLEEICTAIVDCPHTTPKFTDKGILLVRNFNIHKGELILEPTYYTTEEEWRTRTRRCVPENGDVLFSREAPIGEACLAPTNTRFSLGQRTMLLRPDKTLLNSLFLVYVFYSPLIQRQLRNLEAGVTAHHVNVADIRRLKIPVPSISEQERIASIVSATAEKLKLERSEEAKLERIKRGLTNLLLTGKIRVKVG